MQTPIVLDEKRLANIGYWVNGSNTGSSSLFLLAVILGAKPGAANVSYPHDWGDLNRCMELVMSLNDYEDEVGQLTIDDELAIFRAAGMLSPQWNKLYENYKDIRSYWADGDPRKHTLYGLMRDIYGEIPTTGGIEEKVNCKCLPLQHCHVCRHTKTDRPLNTERE